MYRTHNCGQIRKSDVGKEVRLAGWIQTTRDMGGIVFIDLRDQYGITQLVSPDKQELVDQLSKIPSESTISVTGIVKLRDEEIPEYIKNLEDILDFANTVNKAPIDGLDTSIGVVDNFNVFRKDEIKVFEDNKALLQNAPEQEDNMFKIPKVI